MKISFVLTTLAFVGSSVSQKVVGKPVGFASGTTGGGSATPQYPANPAQLKQWLEDSTPRVIVLNKEYNFIGSEGRVTEKGCRPSSNKCVGRGGQDAINGANWCAGQPSVSVTYDKAGIAGINVKSNKSILGVGNKGVIRGKGLRMANGVRNVIIQNIHITELNPQYIWGGDAITVAGTDLIWVDHVKVSRIGRQMFVAGTNASGRITISNSEFDGQTSYSATCDGRHYWGIYLTGSNDYITMVGNYIHHTSGRSPKVGGTTLLHAVNNMWHDNTGHAFDIGSSGSRVVAEGNVFQNVKTPLLANSGKLFSVPSNGGACQQYLKHTCQINAFGSSGSFVGSDTSFLSQFNGYSVAGATTASSNVRNTAGVGKI